MKSERGAMLIMVAISLLALTLFSAFVFDQGILYVARRQAQNAADAGALAAMTALMEHPADLAGARESARAIAHRNAVWNEAPAPADVLVDLVIACPPDTGAGVSCARVDVMRGGLDRFGTL